MRNDEETRSQDGSIGIGCDYFCCGFAFLMLEDDVFTAQRSGLDSYKKVSGRVVKAPKSLHASELHCRPGMVRCYNHNV